MFVIARYPELIDYYLLLLCIFLRSQAGSPTAFADADVERRIRDAADKSSFGCYVPSGALWGAEDIQKMADNETLQGLTITMKKSPSSLKVEPPLMEKMQSHYKDPNANPGITHIS